MEGTFILPSQSQACCARPSLFRKCRIRGTLARAGTPQGENATARIRGGLLRYLIADWIKLLLVVDRRIRPAQSLDVSIVLGGA